MGLKAAWESLAAGEFRQAFNNALVSDDAIETQRLVQNEQEAMISEQHARGLIDVEEAGELMRMSSATAFEWHTANEPVNDPAQVFIDSVKQGTKKMFNSAVGAPAQLLPWWVWALAIVGLILFFWPAIVRLAIWRKGIS